MAREQARFERARFERDALLGALAVGLPGVALSLVLLAASPWPLEARLGLGALALSLWVFLAFRLRERLAHPLRTVSNLLAALRAGDYAVRARGAAAGDALSEVLLEVNALGETLKTERLSAVEAGALVRTILDEIDAAVLAFDLDGRVMLANLAAQRLLGRDEEELLAMDARGLSLEDELAGESVRTISRRFPGGSSRMGLRRRRFRSKGLSHELLILTDLAIELREEEGRAWQRLVRVLSHEINNSLAPIKSIAGSLRALSLQDPRPADADEDLSSGLLVIESRAEGLARFVGSYARLAKLPDPVLADVPLAPLLQRLRGLETRLPVTIEAAELESRSDSVSGAGGAAATFVVRADADQLEQALINLVRNAVEATLERDPGGRVSVVARPEGQQVVIEVLDEGPGPPDSANLFVPFFTTKPGGSGIGLVLCRRIAEAHGGSLVLEERTDRPGGRAILSLSASLPGT